MDDIPAFIAHLAANCIVATSTQNRALSAILFRYCIVLGEEINLPPELVNPFLPCPTILTQEEAMSMIKVMRAYQATWQNYYGSGLRIMECIRLRVRDIDKEFTAHTFRHSFGIRLLQKGYDIHTIQELLGDKDFKITMMYTHVLQRGAMAIISPLDE